jgi:sugar/nucleoside kinase (ribokinase family)
MGAHEPEVVIAGSGCRDIAPDDPRGWRLGGGVTYAALTCARLGVRTAAVIGLDPQAYESHELELLAAAGVTLLRVRLPLGPVFRNVDAPGGRIQTCLEPGLPLPHVAVPLAWRVAPAWILAPVAGELDDAWADPIPTDAFVALGWQGLLRTLRAGTRVERRAPAAGRLVRRADVIGVSEHDVAPGTSPADLAPLLHPGAWLVFTHGVAGGRIAEVTTDGLGSVVHYPAVEAVAELDATGAGDTFLAALVASVVSASRERTGEEIGTPAAPGVEGTVRTLPDVRFAAAAASFVVEGPGLTAVPDRAAVLRRLAGSAGQSSPEPPFSPTYSAKAPR